MEAVGVALSVLPVFSVCLEYFEFFKTAQSWSSDCEILLIKLDFEQWRYILWGEKHTTSDDSGALDILGLKNQRLLDLVTQTLRKIQSLFENSKLLHEKYGLKQVDTETENSARVKPKQRFISSAALERTKRWLKRPSRETDVTKQEKSSSKVISAVRWAIYDKTKFELLVKDIRELVTALYDVMPIPNKQRDKLLLNDMKTLIPNIGRLRQVELASESDYPTWSEAASMIITASEVTSFAPADVGNAQFVQDFVNNSTTLAHTEESKDINSVLASINYTKLYFVLTPECQSISSGEQCSPESNGTLCIQEDFSGFTPEGDDVYWSLGQRLTDSIDPKLPSEVERVLSSDISEDTLDDYKRLVLDHALPAVKVKIYCGPCACAIRTALLICRDQSSKLIKYETCVDERIRTSCCSPSSTGEAISSLLQVMQMTETKQIVRPGMPRLFFGLLKYLDRIWIETRLYHLETERFNVLTTGDTIHRLEEVVGQVAGQGPLAVFIGEIDYLRPILELPVFHSLPRPPRVNEIYFVWREWAFESWKTRYLGTFTVRNYVP